MKTTRQWQCPVAAPVAAGNRKRKAAEQSATPKARRRQNPVAASIATGNPKKEGTEQCSTNKPRREPFKGSSISQLGESSAAAPPPVPTVLCTICMEAKLPSDCSSIKGCTHSFCSDCVSQYVAAKVRENVTVIKCPQPDCKGGSLEPETCRHILPIKVFDRWCTALCEALFAGEVRFYCPFKDCSALLIDDTACRRDGETGGAITQSECPHCHRLFCAQCRVPWHADVTCDVFQRLGADERAKEDIMLMNLAEEIKWQRCAKCRFYVEKTEGCMFMTCRCGFRFCYGCASPMLVDHYCTKCRR